MTASYAAGDAVTVHAGARQRGAVRRRHRGRLCPAERGHGRLPAAGSPRLDPARRPRRQRHPLRPRLPGSRSRSCAGQRRRRRPDRRRNRRRARSTARGTTRQLPAGATTRCRTTAAPTSSTPGRARTSSSPTRSATATSSTAAPTATTPTGPTSARRSRSTWRRGRRPDRAAGRSALHHRGPADDPAGDRGRRGHQHRRQPARRRRLNQLLGSAGPDNYLAGAGNDLLLANSGDSDPIVDCGEGFDTALIDFARHHRRPAGRLRVRRRTRPQQLPPARHARPPRNPSPSRAAGVAPPPPPRPRPKPRPHAAGDPPAPPPGALLLATGPRRRVSFAFTASEPGSSFRCRLDRQPWRPCRSPRAYSVRRGRHAFRVYAIDARRQPRPHPGPVPVQGAVSRRGALGASPTGAS